MTATIRTHVKGFLVTIFNNGRFYDQHVFMYFQSAMQYAESIMGKRMK
jgi:hypothetical protein